jgi:isopentenyl diphosphate isomerase/L-lactate dehydrogenase-like FMN-dependent dehydrogenase
MDGGVAFGSDVLRAICLGSDGAMVGKAFAKALRRGGESEVRKAISLIKEEFQVAMALVGAQSIAELTHEMIFEG